MKQRKINGVFFDAGNTLLRAHPSIGGIYSDTAAEFGVQVTPEEIEKSFQEHWKNTLPLVSNEGHRLTYEKERDWWRYIVREVFQPYVSFHDFEAFFDSLYVRFARSDTWRLYDDVAEVLDHLKTREIKLAIISNWDSRLPGIFDQLGIASYFHTVVVSSLVGYEKPHPAIFQIALERTQLSPSEVLYIGDDPFLDYQAAQKVEINALHLDRYGRFPDHPDKISTLHALLERIS
jgi:putative hydrolase of the HAD superfamily